MAMFKPQMAVCRMAHASWYSDSAKPGVHLGSMHAGLMCAMIRQAAVYFFVLYLSVAAWCLRMTAANMAGPQLVYVGALAALTQPPVCSAHK